MCNPIHVNRPMSAIKHICITDKYLKEKEAKLAAKQDDLDIREATLDVREEDLDSREQQLDDMEYELSTRPNRNRKLHIVRQCKQDCKKEVECGPCGKYFCKVHEGKLYCTDIVWGLCDACKDRGFEFKCRCLKCHDYSMYSMPDESIWD